MYEKEDLVEQVLVDNSARRKRQKALDIQVIIGNPPYSIGAKSADNDNANVRYPNLDLQIANTYAAKSKASLSKGLYDSYIRAIRWASDRIATQGIIGFVTNAGWIDANTADGLRKCLAEEFSSLYIFHLRGNQRTSGEKSRQEGGKIFGSGSRAPIAISILVKNPNAEQHGQIYFHDIGDYLSREDKLEKISEFKSIQGITDASGWEMIVPDEYGDWLNQRDEGYGEYIAMGDKKGGSKSLTINYSNGTVTSRDAYAYNFSKEKLEENVKRSLKFYNQCVANNELEHDAKKISWSVSLKKTYEKKQSIHFSQHNLRICTYRPFTKTNLYFSKELIERRNQLLSLLPKEQLENKIIVLSGVGASKGATVFIANTLFDFQTLSNCQGFPLYLYEEVSQDKAVSSGDLFDESLDLTVTETKFERKDGISDEGLQHFQTAYPSEQITKEDIFYYTYGLLHSEEYRERYADNLTKELPRIPCVKKADDFWAFSKAGRDLAHWHLNYETVEPYKAALDTGSTPYNQLTDADFYVEKMKFAKKGEKGTVIYNKRITIKDIPIEAYDYVVNGKPALEWVMERQGVSTHKDSGIVNDANDWAIETMNNAAYPLELFLRVITVSLETMKIVKALPKLDI